MKRSHPGIFAAILLAWAAFSAAPSAQSPTPARKASFKSAADLVTIQASVRDPRGRPMPGLTADDFEIRDNGQVRPVFSVRNDQSPLSLAVLVDMSGSMRLSSKISMVRQTFDALVSQLRPGEDEAAIFTFDASLHERHDFTSDPEQLRNALAEFEPFGTTSLYDATAETARRLSARSATRKAIIVLTDGIDTSSLMTATEVSGLASSIDVPVYVVATVPTIDRRTLSEDTRRTTTSESGDLRDLANWTGGQVIFATTFTESTAVASGVVSELRQQYVLAIEAANAPEWHRLDIRVKRPASATVKARSGYFGG
jgi:Ca-activated chloride channel family protein